jgi:hypothetical protein
MLPAERLEPPEPFLPVLSDTLFAADYRHYNGAPMGDASRDKLRRNRKGGIP